MKVVNVIGARPNLMKMAPIVAEMRKFPDEIEQILVHTGQHYDEKMNQLFFEELGLPCPDVNLEVGSGSHGLQTGRIMAAFEDVCIKTEPDLVIVVGDVNSTIACALTAKKCQIKVAHVEAGLRSRDMSMPEEINRLCTDAISDYLFTTDHFATQNLLSEGISEDRVYFVGNVMIDTLELSRARAQNLNTLGQLGLEKGGFATLTLHRPANVDDAKTLSSILEAVHEIGEELPIVFPIHPRTRQRVEEFNLSHLIDRSKAGKGIWTTEPLGYLEFLHLNMNARMVLTDSGGLQEETTVLGVQCLTLRNNTERPITCSDGTNRLAGNDTTRIMMTAHEILSNPIKRRRVPEKWDGKAAERVVKILRESFSKDCVAQRNHRAV